MSLRIRPIARFSGLDSPKVANIPTASYSPCTLCTHQHHSRLHPGPLTGRNHYTWRARRHSASGTGCSCPPPPGTGRNTRCTPCYRPVSLLPACPTNSTPMRCRVCAKETYLSNLVAVGPDQSGLSFSPSLSLGIACAIVRLQTRGIGPGRGRGVRCWRWSGDGWWRRPRWSAEFRYR